MSMRRLFATLLIGSLGLLAAASPAQAATTGSANKAATWLTTQVSGGSLDNGFSKMGASADGLIGLASATDPALQPTIDKLMAFVKAGAGDYASSGGAPAAAKLAIVAAAYGLDPTSFGGVNLATAMTKGIESDGSVGPYPSAFSSGLTMAGLDRTKTALPATLTTWLLTQQNADGGFGYAAGTDSDADNTALAIVGLTTDDSATAKAALAKALAWASKNQNSDGSWAGWVPVSSTCTMAQAQLTAGVDASKALAFATAQQLKSGAIAVPLEPGKKATEPDQMATAQCLPVLGGVTYANVSWKPAAVTPPKPTTKPTTTTTAPKPAASASQTPGRGVPAHTGVEDDPVAPIAAIALLVTAGLAWAGLRK